jgi:biopolymer transport protein ExbD
MTPMIDVVFLLIIFFLVSSHLARQETQLELDLPQASSGEQAAATTAPLVVINVTEFGEFMLAGRQVTAEQLQQQLRNRIRKVGPGLEVRIRSDRNIAFAKVRPIMLACAKVGIWNVSFAVYQAVEGPR